MSNDLSELTVLVITHNEAVNIERTLQSLSFAPKILLLDSFSSDKTVQLASQFPNVENIQNTFISFADQCNFGLQSVQTKWVLSIDADYIFPENCQSAIRNALAGEFDAYRAAFKYCVLGKPVFGSILPPRTILFRKQAAKYVNDGHSHYVVIEGPVGILPFRVFHDDRKSLRTWGTSQLRYAGQEARKIGTSSFASLETNDKVRKFIVFAPIMVFIYVYFFRGGFLSGWRGLFYALQRLLAELLLSLFLLDEIIKRKIL